MLARTLGSSERFFDLHETLKTEGLGEFAGELYCLVVANHDDHGRFAGDAFTVKHAVYASSLRTLDEFDRALDAMHDVGLIVRYMCRRTGKRALQVVQHEQHQDLKTLAPSKFAAPGAHDDGAPVTFDATLRLVLAAVERVLKTVTTSPGSELSTAVTTSRLISSEAIVGLLDAPMSTTRLAGTLAKLGVYPQQRRIGEQRVRGYDVDELGGYVTACHDSRHDLRHDLSRLSHPKGTEENSTEGNQRATSPANDEPREALFDDIDPVETPAPAKTKRGRKAPTNVRRETAERLVELYRRIAPSLQPVHALTDKRITAANAAVERQSLAKWEVFFARVEASSYCKGSRGWRADFEWCLKVDTWPKVFEGKYDDRTPTSTPKVIRNAADARAAVKERGLDHVTKDGIDLR